MEELHLLHLQEETGLLSQVQLLRRKEIKINLKKKALREEIKWKQRSQIRWLKGGDKNTKFFHRMASSRRRKNFIHSLQVDWERVESRFDICEQVVHYYKPLYEAPHRDFPIPTLLPFKELCEEDRLSLEGPFEESEVKEAVWQLGEDKAPGPDGFPIIFFKFLLELVKVDILAFVLEFFERGIISKDLGAGFITLVSKKPGASALNDFRPFPCLVDLIRS